MGGMGRMGPSIQWQANGMDDLPVLVNYQAMLLGPKDGLTLTHGTWRNLRSGP